MNRTAKRGAASLLALLAGAACASATTIHVPAEHAMLQAALDAAAAGDTVLVAPGQYKEKIQIKPGTVLKSEKGPDSTAIVSPTTIGDVLKERLVEVLPGADRSTVIEGFTLQGNIVMGAGIFCENASPTIRGNVLRALGWGIVCRYSDALVDNNVIEGCRPFGITIFACSPEIRRNTIHDDLPRAISVSGRKSKPVIGGRKEYANRIFGNTYAIVDESRNDIDATWNDWGWATTTEMERADYPTDITVFMDGNDMGETGRGKGKVDYRNWIRPDASSADGSDKSSSPSTASATKSSDSSTSASPGAASSNAVPPGAVSPGHGSSGSSPAPAGTGGKRWLLPVLLAVGLLLVFVIVSRRGKT